VFCQPDNHKTRYIVEQRCRELADVTLFLGGNDGVEDGARGTYGNVQAYVRSGGKDLTNPPSMIHPEIASSNDPLPTEKGCGAAAESAPQLLITNATVATAMVAAYCAWRAGTLDFEEVFLDAELVRMSPVKRALRSADARPSTVVED
jgi:molybdopterin/thiamine biosynthesis adenylyltransferase